MENKDTLLTFPCDFTIKIIGNATDEFESTAIDIVKKHFPHFSIDQMKVNISANSKYKALSVIVHANSKEQLDNLYRELSASPQVLMTL